MRNRFE